uniref:Rho-GAP domain-containing protein n=1 Tax=Clastoptera arizonana TaxID=38151 RepID=A0A1B6CIK0_9HEMI
MGQGQDASAREKRLKKNIEYLLGLTMLESSVCEEDYLLRHVVSECGKLEMCLANACVDHEAKVEINVLGPLQQVCETDVPNIMKHKRNLAKLILDMDSARTRYQTALKHSSSSSSQGNKVDSIKDELEEAETKVEQCRDALACEMFQLISKEADLAATILEYAKLQRSYHQAALSTLDEMIPELENSIVESSMKPVFGIPLEEHLRVTDRKVAFPIELCVCALCELGMDEEGLFRIAGGASKVRRMKLSLDANCMTLETALDYRDPHVVASVLKSYLRQMPEPLMTYALHDEWMSAARVGTTNDARLQALWAVMQKLPQNNLDNLRYLIKFLALLSKNQETNKMTPQNIAIVIAPNLLWSPNDDGTNIGANMNTANLHSIIVDSLVSYADWFFPGEFNMYLTLSKEGLLNGHTRSSSGDTQLITVNESEMKRTQSSSSLSEDHSPPQGSPKPIARNRKSKPAPVPPINREASLIDTNKSSSLLSDLADVTPASGAPTLIGFEKLMGSNEDKEAQIEKDIDTSINDSDVTTKLIESESIIQASDVLTKEETMKPLPSRKPEPNSRNNVESIYGTLERKRPPRPTPAPRTFVDPQNEDVIFRKPIVPERPATLQRPLSSSFRISKNIETTGESSDKLGLDLTREIAKINQKDRQNLNP